MSSTPTFRFSSTEDQMLFRPREVTIEQEVGKIDFASISTTRLAPGASALAVERPLGFAWGVARGANRAQVGYLAGTSDDTKRNGSASTNVVNLKWMGAAASLRTKRFRAWENVSIPYVLNIIASENRFNLVTDESTVKWSRLTQNGDSDWALVVSLAKKLGWWAYVEGTTIMVLDPDKIVHRIPALELRASSDDFKQHTEDLPLFGERKMATRVGRFVDQATGKEHRFVSGDRVSVVGGAPTATSLVEEVALDERTYAEAQAAFEGIERNAAWYIERTLNIEGRPDIRPLAPVLVETPRVQQIDKTNSGEGWSQYNGFWLVRSVRNHLTFGRDAECRTEVVLVRDAKGVTPNVRQRRPGAMTKFEGLPPSRLLEGKWVASWKKAA